MAFGEAVVGLNLYAAFGQSGAVNENEAVPGGADSDWTRVTAESASSYVGATVGFAIEGESVKPEAWLRITGASAWSDAQAFGPAERNQWDDTTDLLLDRTVGLKGAHRVGGGLRAAIDVSDTVEVTPALLVDLASGHTFAIDRLAENVEDPDESAVAQAEDDIVRAKALALRAGVGITYQASEELQVITTVGVDLQAVGFRYDNNAQVTKVLGSEHYFSEDKATTVRLPIVSLGGEYAFSEGFAVRGAARATTMLNRVHLNSTDQTGIEADNWALTESSSTELDFDGGDTPAVTAGIGPSIRLGTARLEGVVGGALVGTGDDFFSRIDAVFAW